MTVTMASPMRQPESCLKPIETSAEAGVVIQGLRGRSWRSRMCGQAPEAESLEV